MPNEHEFDDDWYDYTEVKNEPQPIPTGTYPDENTVFPDQEWG